jgi:predicted double-glycine peptidase
MSKMRSAFPSCSSGFGVLFLTLIGITICQAADDSRPIGKSTETVPSYREGIIWRVTRNCGVNCLYVLLRVNGRSVVYKDLMNDLHARSSGFQNSMTDLLHTARDWGLQCQLGKTTIDSLESLPKPVIAHVEKGSPETGHFVLVMKIGPEGIEVMDGTTGSLITLTTREFAQGWTGYILYIPRPWYARIPLWSYCMLAVAMGGGISAAMHQLWRSKNRTAVSTTGHIEDVSFGVAPSRT